MDGAWITLNRCIRGVVAVLAVTTSSTFQSSILLTFNLLAILTIYPAIISLDLRRRKNARRDVCCCVVANELLVADDDYSVGIGVKPHVQVCK